MKKEKGFTLIELVIVLILIGVLAAVAVPKFMDLQTDAKKSGTKGAVASVRSAINIAYANKALKGSAQFVSDEAGLKSLMQNGRLPDNPAAGATSSDKAGVNVGSNTIGSVSAADSTTETKVGWRYNPTTGQFWSNWGGGFAANKF